MTHAGNKKAKAHRGRSSCKYARFPLWEPCSRQLGLGGGPTAFCEASRLDYCYNNFRGNTRRGRWLSLPDAGRQQLHHQHIRIDLTYSMPPKKMAGVTLKGWNPSQLVLLGWGTQRSRMHIGKTSLGERCVEQCPPRGPVDDRIDPSIDHFGVEVSGCHSQYLSPFSHIARDPKKFSVILFIVHYFTDYSFFIQNYIKHILNSMQQDKLFYR